MKIGDYVRTKYGISKIISNPNTDKFNIDIFKKDGITLRCIRQKDIIKSSPNIIDLIQVGDYVNGMLVIEETPKDKRKKQQIIVDSTAFEWGTERLFNEDIKSIVTKECFESMEYKVKEE